MDSGRRTTRQIEAEAELDGKRKRRLPWQRKGLSRVERVIAFLEDLPITKGIKIGTKLKLLPGQRRFIEAVYGSTEVRLAVRSEPRGNGKTGLVAGPGAVSPGRAGGRGARRVLFVRGRPAASIADV